MPWIIFAAVIWLYILFFLRFSLGKYWSAGFWALLVGYFLNDFFLANQFYVFQNLLFPLQGFPLGYLIGLAGIGIIVISYFPEEKGWQLPYLILLSFIFTALEFFAVKQGYILYLQWSLYYSFFYKLIALIAIVWLSNLTIRRRRGYFFR